MTWLDDLRPARLGGIRFHVQSSTVSGIGAENVTFEPFRQDYASAQYVGRGIPKFSLESYLVGNDYHIERDAFVRMLETPGPKVLEHPYWGRKNVSLYRRVDMQESLEFGGMVKFTLELVEVAPLTAPIPLQPSGTQYAESAKQASISQFNTSFKAPKGPFYAPMLVAMRSVATRLVAINGKIGAVTLAFSDFTSGVTQIDLQLGNLLATPNLLGGAIVGVITSMFDLFRRAVTGPTVLAGSIYAQSKGTGQVIAAISDDFMALEAYAATFPLPNLEQTKSLLEYRASLRSLMVLIRTYGVIEASALLLDSATTYRSSREAEFARDRAVSNLGELLRQAEITVEMSLQIRNLRASIQRSLTELAQRLPRMYELKVGRDVPATVLAWELYGDIRRDEEIINHNKIKYPNKIKAGTVLEVLSD